MDQATEDVHVQDRRVRRLVGGQLQGGVGPAGRADHYAADVGKELLDLHGDQHLVLDQQDAPVRQGVNRSGTRPGISLSGGTGLANSAASGTDRVRRTRAGWNPHVTAARPWTISAPVARR